MKVFKVTPDKGCAPCIEKEIKDVMVWLEESSPDETITIEVMEMSEQEYSSLPEYMGP